MANKSPQNYAVIGLMSGTSLDGVDIAFCRFIIDNQKWTYEIVCAETVAYPVAWREKLLGLESTDAVTFNQVNVEYGYYLGKLVTDFVKKYSLKPDFIASHGHTIFHQPERRFTVQVGSGNSIAAECGLTTVCDFRSLDVALGGQGAPLVPVGDKLLFEDYSFCLNLGGFANVSYEYDSRRIAFDICPVNIVMNAICNAVGKEYDDGGQLASTGLINQALLNELNALAFYQMPLNSPKSLGKEWVIKNIHPLIEKFKLNERDFLRTFCEHVAIQTAKALNHLDTGKILVTGGGAYNAFLMDAIRRHTSHTVIVPDKNTIEFKEALIFAFLGVLRMRNENNCLQSVTGARYDNCGGAVYSGKTG
jgi:anhydro-N-acetylmuramic acid kinase